MARGASTYILDEPTSGLHLADVDHLIATLDRIVDAGGTAIVIVIEHNLDVVARADWVIDLSPGAGHDGGRVAYHGPPAGLPADGDSLTGRYLHRTRRHRLRTNDRNTPMRWTESIDIDRPAPRVHQAIADEHELLQWSAWPASTGYTCSIDGDGTTLGSVIVFRDDTGVEQGRQRLSSVSPNRVEYRLRNRGPGGRDMSPEVDFRIEDLSPDSTRVYLDFRNRVPLPPPLRQIAERVIGRKVRALHVEDLRLLKAHVERAPR